MFMKQTTNRLFGDDYVWFVLEELNMSIATPTQAHEILDLKGGDQVNF